ncbi:guanylate kinase [Oligoflexia bacterium]|nr:guanylate kinase [Oligoflexia bacterium]
MAVLGEHYQREGILFCLCGPSGSGKSTHCGYLLAQNARTLQFSVSFTTRLARAGEVQGEDYHFVSKSEFEKRIAQDEFVEWEETHGNYYGTSAKTLEHIIEGGGDLLLEVDIRGALNFKAAYPRNAVIVFMIPPDFETLCQRLTARGEMPEEELATRLKTTEREYDAFLKVAEQGGGIDYLVINDKIEETSKCLDEILQVERRQLNRIADQSLMKLCMLPANKKV